MIPRTEEAEVLQEAPNHCVRQSWRQAECERWCWQWCGACWRIFTLL